MRMMSGGLAMEVMKPVMMPALVLAAALLSGPVVQAQQPVPTEVTRLAGQQITLHVHPFLTPDELVTLRFAASQPQGLALFVAQQGGHAALVLAPAEGFLREGNLVPSATAMSGLPDAAAARQAALTVCDKARAADGPACVVVLEVAPAP